MSKQKKERYYTDPMYRRFTSFGASVSRMVTSGKIGGMLRRKVVESH